MTLTLCSSQQGSCRACVRGSDLVDWGLEAGVRQLPTLHTPAHTFTAVTFPLGSGREAAVFRPG